MKRLLRLLILAVLAPGFLLAQTCPAGYTASSLNWDALDFLTTNGMYATYVSAGAAATQKFALGTQVATITHNYTGANAVGENTTHTGEAGSNATGADVQFSGNGTITVTFESAVQNVMFSLYDIDRSQRAAFSASNGIVPATINLATLGATILTISNNNLFNARVDASNTSKGNTSVDAAVNVSITGPITSFTITISNTGSDPNLWLSDIAACSAAAAFPTNYYSVSQPFTGQPGYVLVSANNSVYQVSPTNGASKLLFTDPSGSNINSMGYDPYNRILYYTYSLTGSPATDKKVMKYSFVTETITTAITDVTSLGVITYENGVESGAAAFYNGSLFLGIEGYNNANASTARKSIVWRIDFNGSGMATGATQVYGVTADDGSNTIHDWSDIGINNGILYDFDGSTSGEDVYHYNMQSGVLANYNPTWRPSQVAVNWTGQVYNMDSTITPYNGTTAITMAQRYTITASPTIPTGTSFGDAAEAFRPDADFGDAPATYDPIALSPALHEYSTNLRFGSGVNDEYAKKTSALADGDTDDGMPFVAIVNQGGNYLANVNVFNNTGSNATVCAWVDFNNDGVFATSEGISVTVPSSAVLQNVDLFWPSPNNTLAPHSYTFLRVRVTSQSNGMTASNPTGYYSNGEVEDYRVLVNSSVLPLDLISFSAKKTQAGQALVTWEIADELPGAIYELERSADSRNWVTINKQHATAKTNKAAYEFADATCESGYNHYRLKIIKPTRNFIYSPLQTIYFDKAIQFVVAPNPLLQTSRIIIHSSMKGEGLFQLMDMTGKGVYQTHILIPEGASSIPFLYSHQLPAGTYEAHLWIGKQRLSQRVIIR
ncbi:MAG: type sorting protein [Flaviaesturariibacter sp.]|nr:type sorting protein [Flaviaesturariibacter sp.]